jgi:hypothetical protein
MSILLGLCLALEALNSRYGSQHNFSRRFSPTQGISSKLVMPRDSGTVLQLWDSMLGSLFVSASSSL